jgi:hypothetical protein
MNNGKRPNQSDILRRSCASRPNKTDSQAQDVPSWRAFLAAMGASRALEFFNTRTHCRLLRELKRGRKIDQKDVT